MSDLMHDCQPHRERNHRTPLHKLSLSSDTVQPLVKFRKLPMRCEAITFRGGHRCTKKAGWMHETTRRFVCSVHKVSMCRKETIVQFVKFNGEGCIFTL